MGFRERNYDTARKCQSCGYAEGKEMADRIPGSIRKEPPNDPDGRPLCNFCWARTPVPGPRR